MNYDINSRIKIVREALNLSQEKLGSAIGLSKSSISNIESSSRKVTEKHILLLESALNVNQEWLRTGKGDMFLNTSKVSLDEYARQNKLSELDIAILKVYMDIPEEIRKDILVRIQRVLEQHKDKEDRSDEIDKALEEYRLELEAEQKGVTSGASQNSGDDEGNGSSA